MIVALFVNLKKNHSKQIGKEIHSFLIEQGIDVFAEDSIASEIGIKPLSCLSHSSVDLIISLGGDGSILRLIHHYPHLEAPIIGINLGSLGFLADIPLTEIYPSLQEILEGKFIAQERLMMEGQTKNSTVCFAVNEVVIHRAQNPCLIDLAIYVDGRYLNTFSADGVIISTPSGSTAYSLAAGGPILTPELEAYVITPICPHTISNRPLVLMPKKEIRVEYISEHAPVEVIYDGFSRHSMSMGEQLSIRNSKRKFRLISLLHHDYFSTLRQKLGWTGKLRSASV